MRVGVVGKRKEGRKVIRKETSVAVPPRGAGGVSRRREGEETNIE